MAMPHRTEGEFLAYFEAQIPHLATKRTSRESAASLTCCSLKRARSNGSSASSSPAAIAITVIVVGIVVQVLNNLPG